MKKWLKLNLKMFEGGGGEGEGGEAEGGLGTETEQAEVLEQQGETEEPGKTQESKETEYVKFKEDYKDLIGRDIEKAVNRRYTENQNLHQQLKSYNPLLELLGARYGVKTGKAEDIMAAIENDDSFYENAALKSGMSVDQYKTMLKLEAENRTLHAEQKKSMETLQREQRFARWDREAELCRQMFPGFDLNQESQNQQFLTMLDAGCSMDTAYKAIHFDEISRGLISNTEMKTQKLVADTIRAGATRPAESAAKKGAGAKAKIDVANMTYAQMDALIERARNGEQVTLS